MTKYEWAHPRFKAANAARVAAELEKIREQVGTLNAADVVAKAASPRSAMHKLFTWDDTEAAQRYREEQARGMIRALRIVVRGPKGPENQRVFVHVTKAPEGPSYVPLSRVIESADLRNEVRAKARTDLESWYKRYQEIQARVPEAFDAVQAAIDALG